MLLIASFSSIVEALEELLSIGSSIKIENEPWYIGFLKKLFRVLRENIVNSNDEEKIIRFFLLLRVSINADKSNTFSSSIILKLS